MTTQSAGPAAPAPIPHSRGHRMPSIAEAGPLIALFAACAFFISQSHRFLSFQNFSLILQQTIVVAVIAIGQTLIVLTAGIDLSCGMVMAFGSIIMTKFAVVLGVPPVLAILCGIAASALFGLLNGMLVTRVKLPSFIVTLGTLNIAFALTQLYSNAETVSTSRAIPAPPLESEPATMSTCGIIAIERSSPATAAHALPDARCG